MLKFISSEISVSLKEKNKEYHTVAIPKQLAERIKRLVAKRLGYMSVADFVREATREKLSREEARLRVEEIEEQHRKEESIY